MTYFEITLPTAAENVALDEASSTAAEEGSGGEALRVWELDHRAVVLGASGRMAEEVDLDACLADRVPIARRSSGGGTVLIGPGALNFTVVLPVEAAPGSQGGRHDPGLRPGADGRGLAGARAGRRGCSGRAT